MLTKIILSMSLLISLNAYSEESRTPQSIPDVPKSTLDKVIDDVHISGEVSMVSNYVFRGITQTEGKSAVQGWAALRYKIVSAGVFTSEVEANLGGNTVVRNDVYFVNTYLPLSKDLAVLVNYNRNANPNAHAFDYDEYGVDILYKTWKVSLANVPDYLKLGTSYQYLGVTKTTDLKKDSSVALTVGHVEVEKPTKVNIKSYQELKVSYEKNMGPVKASVAWSTTNRKNVSDVDYKDSAVIMGVSVPFN